jgi:hypothetical protein
MTSEEVDDVDSNLMTTPATGVWGYVAAEQSATGPKPSVHGTSVSPAMFGTDVRVRPAAPVASGARVTDLLGSPSRGAPV